MNLEILFEDNDIIVCYKPAGIPTQTSKMGEQDMVSILKNYLYKKQADKKEPYVAVIHRLDQPVEGLLVFAKTTTPLTGRSRRCGRPMNTCPGFESRCAIKALYFSLKGSSPVLSPCTISPTFLFTIRR